MSLDYFDRPETESDTLKEAESIPPLEELIARLNAQNQDLVSLINRRNQLRDRIEEQKSKILKQLDSINRSQFEFENATLKETDKKMNVGMALPKSEGPQWQR